MAAIGEELRRAVVTGSEEKGGPLPRGGDGSSRAMDEQVAQIFSLVHQAVAAATDVFLAADRDAARLLVQRDQLIDALHDQTEQAVLDQLRRRDVLDDETLDRLVLVLRILPELERSGDLAEHIASHAVQGLAMWLTPRARSLVEQMGTLGAQMWELAAHAFATGNGDLADVLRARDDEIDDLHVGLTAELAASGAAVPVAIEMALVARYFERLGDHAVNVTRRLQHSQQGT